MSRARAAGAVVFRDMGGNLLWLSYVLHQCSSASQAEVLALEWAMKMATDKGWNNIVWVSRALGVVKEIKTCNNP